MSFKINRLFFATFFFCAVAFSSSFVNAAMTYDALSYQMFLQENTLRIVTLKTNLQLAELDILRYRDLHQIHTKLFQRGSYSPIEYYDSELALKKAEARALHVKGELAEADCDQKILELKYATELGQPADVDRLARLYHERWAARLLIAQANFDDATAVADQEARKYKAAKALTSREAEPREEFINDQARYVGARGDLAAATARLAEVKKFAAEPPAVATR